MLCQQKNTGSSTATVRLRGFMPLTRSHSHLGSSSKTSTPKSSGSKPTTSRASGAPMWPTVSGQRQTSSPDDRHRCPVDYSLSGLRCPPRGRRLMARPTRAHSPRLVGSAEPVCGSGCCASTCHSTPSASVQRTRQAPKLGSGTGDSTMTLSLLLWPRGITT